jgi:hypothetical protein
MEVQVLPDGADFESSVPYHRLMTELCLGSWRLADFRGEPLPQPYTDSLRRMLQFLDSVQRPDGLLPQVGDADDGRLHILSEYGTWNPQDARHLFGPATQCFANPEWAPNAGEWGAWETAWWGFEPPAAPLARSIADGVRHFPYAGLTVARTPRRYLLVSNGIVGTGGFGNHKHNDQLGFEYHVDGCAVFVDPGSYVYTPDPEARNAFRSTRSHNTLMIDGHEQNEFRDDWLFRMFETARPTHVRCDDDGRCIVYTGRHRGYERLPSPVTHERTFTLSRIDGTLTIRDHVRASGNHRVRWHFRAAPGADVRVDVGGDVDIASGIARVTMSVPAGLTPSLAETWYSPSYGVRRRCIGITIETDVRVEGSREYVFRITSQ